MTPPPLIADRWRPRSYLASAGAPIIQLLLVTVGWAGRNYIFSLALSIIKNTDIAFQCILCSYIYVAPKRVAQRTFLDITLVLLKFHRKVKPSLESPKADTCVKFSGKKYNRLVFISVSSVKKACFLKVVLLRKASQ